jgi:hypothetical protein
MGRKRLSKSLFATAALLGGIVRARETKGDEEDGERRE